MIFLNAISFISNLHSSHPCSLTSHLPSVPPLFHLPSGLCLSTFPLTFMTFVLLFQRLRGDILNTLHAHYSYDKIQNVPLGEDVMS